MREQLGDRGQEPDRDQRGLLRIGLAEVYNPSMQPTLYPGDQLVVRYGVPVRPGDVVVVRHPFRQDLLIVKRAVERREGGWWVKGDNPYVENDSREFGVVPDELVVARAWLRLRPRPGAGRRGQRSMAGLVSWAVSAVRPVGSRSWRRLRSAPADRSASRRLRAR
ncbi:nickel-type superoxide dismutase maturation protease [Streptomyces sp. WAC05858]|nr:MULTISPECIES: nickel-type superoxide dismutase maturation protease [Streptomyces]RSS48383.1 nickel-type superoxide dismutase maturation protease [Streptomyces sp. WAC05858]WJD97284.1 nickel-type superoxide dismutase maturation protease [Streptomyces antimycoticus]WTB05585.1 nickel-type superoxide dismutase maturation protease [Streptomyces antimycoticus]